MKKDKHRVRASTEVDASERSTSVDGYLTAVALAAAAAKETADGLAEAIRKAHAAGASLAAIGAAAGVSKQAISKRLK